MRSFSLDNSVLLGCVFQGHCSPAGTYEGARMAIEKVYYDKNQVLCFINKKRSQSGAGGFNYAA